MPQPRSRLQQAASRANGTASRGPVTPPGKARAAANGTRHGLRGGTFALLPGEDARELEELRHAVTADWAPRDAYERRWVRELVTAYWRQERLRGLELAALAAAEAEAPPSEVSLRRLLTFARYGARIDGDIGRALRALRVLRDRPDAQLAAEPACTPEPEPPHPAETAAPKPARVTARTSEPELAPRSRAEPTSTPAPLPLNRHQRRRLEALQRQEQRRAA